MPDKLDTARRRFIQLGTLLGVTLLIQPSRLFADEITDLASSNDTVNQIIAVRLWPSSVYTRLTIETDSEITAKYSVLDNPRSLVVDILNSQLNTVLKSLSSKVLADDPIISDVKVGQLNETTVQIIIDLKQHVLAQTRSLAPVNLGSVNYKYRYVLDMYPQQDDKSDAPLSDNLLAFLELNNEFNNTSGVESKIIASSVAIQTKTTPLFKPLPIIKINQAKKDNIIVMLDPGHGGEDPGAVGPAGTKEKDIVLDIAKRLRDILNDNPHINAQMTRTQDIFIPLGTRVAIARRAKADLFVSIHADAFTTPQAKGSSVFVLSDRGASSSFARWLAKTQNQADLIGGMSFQTHDHSITKVLLDMTQSWTLQKSDKLGNILLAKLGGINQLHSRQIEKAGFAVLKAPDIPSTLVETAFISNPAEEARLRQSSFRDQIAQALASGISNFAQVSLG